MRMETEIEFDKHNPKIGWKRVIFHKDDNLSDDTVLYVHEIYVQMNANLFLLILQGLKLFDNTGQAITDKVNSTVQSDPNHHCNVPSHSCLPSYQQPFPSLL